MAEQLWTVGEPLQPRGYTRQEIADALDEGGPMFFPPKRDLPATAEELGSVLVFVVLKDWSIEVGQAAGRPAAGGGTPGLLLTHRCGFEVWLDQRAYLPDVINGPVAGHHRDGCGS